VEPRIEAATLEELVDKEAVMAIGAVAQQAREVAVAEAAEHLHLGTELVVADAGGVVRAEALHGHRASAFGEHGAVHEHKAAAADDVVRGDVVASPVALAT
jgi:hypothetical protein